MRGSSSVSTRPGGESMSWTVNDEAAIRHLIALGVDGIFTDDPLLARRILGRAR
ncbi:MAG: hypothetical protein C0393_00035 [Anaerolinea sp.]|nr:hypothetical protein [Anaerolinea sp.]